MSLSYVEYTNQYGFIDCVLMEDGVEVTSPVSGKSEVVCPSCLAATFINRGQGSLCPHCAHEDFLESQLNYEEMFGG